MRDSVHEITSGGERVGATPEAVLCIDKETATKLFRIALAAFLDDPEITHWWYVVEPIADHWNMTSTTKDGTHRIAEMRWSVTAKIGVLRETQEERYRVDGWEIPDEIETQAEPRFPIEKLDAAFRKSEGMFHGDPTL